MGSAVLKIQNGGGCNKISVPNQRSNDCTDHEPQMYSLVFPAGAHIRKMTGKSKKQAKKAKEEERITITATTNAATQTNKQSAPKQGKSRSARKRRAAAKATRPVQVAPGDYSDPFSAGNKRHFVDDSIPACAVACVDPFDPRCDGMKIHDSDLRDSSVTTDRETITFSTGTTGTAAGHEIFAIFMADPIQFVYQPTGTGTAWADSINFTQATTRVNVPSLMLQASAVRPVCGGIRIKGVQGMNVAGLVHVCLVPHDLSGTSWNNTPGVSNGGAGSSTSIIASMQQCVGYRSIPLSELGAGKEITVPYRVCDPSGFRYHEIGKPAGSLSKTSIPWNTSSNEGVLTSLTGWMDVVVYANALASFSTAYISVTEILREEYFPDVNSSLQAPTPAAPDQPVLRAAINNFQALIPPVNIFDDDNPSGTGWDVVWREAASIAKDAAPFIVESALGLLAL